MWTLQINKRRAIWDIYVYLIFICNLPLYLGDSWDFDWDPFVSKLLLSDDPAFHYSAGVVHPLHGDCVEGDAVLDDGDDDEDESCDWEQVSILRDLGHPHRYTFLH